MEGLIKNQREAISDLDARIQAYVDEITKVRAPSTSKYFHHACTNMIYVYTVEQDV